MKQLNIMFQTLTYSKTKFTIRPYTEECEITVILYNNTISEISEYISNYIKAFNFEDYKVNYYALPKLWRLINIIPMTGDKSVANMFKDYNINIQLAN